MEKIFYITLFILGSLFGSFGSVLINRLKTGKRGIISGRSECYNCKEKLKIKDLIPIFSWLFNSGKCRHCKSKVSIIYPILEISTAITFVMVGVFLIDINLIINGNLYEVSKLIFWLYISFITILYIFYDILFLEIHEGIMLSGITVAFLANTISSILSRGIQETILIGIFGIIVLGILYIIMLKELREIYDIFLLFLAAISGFFIYKYFPYTINEKIFSGIIGALGIFIFFYLQIFLSRGRAMGGGDLRIGIMIGLILGINYSLIGVINSYIVGSIIGIFIIIKNLKSKKLNVVPFGPFLGIGFFMTIFFGAQIKTYIENYLTIM